jgi:hypothetical protein
VKFTPFKVSVVGFVSLNVSADVPPGAIAFGVNVFVIVVDPGLTMLAIRAPAE